MTQFVFDFILGVCVRQHHYLEHVGTQVLDFCTLGPCNLRARLPSAFNPNGDLADALHGLAEMAADVGFIPHQILSEPLQRWIGILSLGSPHRLRDDTVSNLALIVFHFQEIGSPIWVSPLYGLSCGLI